MKILGYHITDHMAESTGNICCQPPYLDWLLQDRSEHIKVFYHLDYSVANLLKLIELEDWELRKLHEKGRLYKNSYKLEYIPHKWFGINRNGQYAGFSDMSQYIDWHLEPDDDIKAKAKEAAEIGTSVYNALSKLGLHPRTLTSPVNAFAKEALSKLDLPTVDDIPEEAVLFANECCHGAWLETFKKGHWDTVHDWDITACYPYHTRNLLDLRLGQWIESDKYIPEAKYGYCKGIISVYKTPSPIIYRTGNRQNYNPVGSWPAYEHKGKIDFIRKYRIGDFELEKGWFWIPDKEVYPLRQSIDYLYTMREQVTGLEREIIKRVPNGIWGLMLHTKSHAREGESILGDYYNPVWAAEVENPACIEVARFIYDNDLPSSLLSVAVDGIATSGDITNGNQNGMGSWRKNTQCPGFIISSGIAAIKDSKNNKDFSLRYDWLMDQINSKPKSAEYTMTKMSPVSLGKAISQNRIQDMGKLEKITKYVDVSYEMKRDYPKLPRNGKQLLENKYDSIPFDVSRLQVEEIQNDVFDLSGTGLSDLSVLER